MYYRVAIRREGDLDQSPLWKWFSTALWSLNAVLLFFQYYPMLPLERLRVFSSSERVGLAEQLEQENQGLATTSVTAEHFLSERMLLSSVVWSTSACEEGTERKRGSVTVISQQAVHEPSGEGSALGSRGMSVLERRREELDGGAGGDHDLPYSFSLPFSLPQVLAWMRLLTKVEHGELQP